MSQEVKIAGALFSNVPSIQVPDSNNVYHSFVDTSDTTAAAADVASGKYFYTSAGVRTAGTSSGGTTELKMGVLRPDAEIVQTYSYDKYIVADEGKTIPSYTTSSTTLLGSSNLSPKVSIDLTNYNYYVLIRTLTIPQYSITTTGKGRQEYTIGSYLYEIADFPANTFSSIIEPTKKVTFRNTNVYEVGVNKIIYYASDTTLDIDATNTYACIQTVVAPSKSSTALTLKSPNFLIRGHTTFYSSTYFNATTDIRYQYIIETYRAPKDNLNIDGWGIYNQAQHVVDCVDNGGTLT